MAIASNYYLDAATLDLATSVYLDSSLAFLAPDGFYKEGSIVRQQAGGFLLSVESCGTCGTPCGQTISGVGGQGIYLINLEVGSTVGDVGAIIIQFDARQIPDGIRATYDGVVYNKLSSETFGVLQSSIPGDFTFVGLTTSDCGISGTTYPALTEYLYNGSFFAPTGGTQSLTINPGDVNLTNPRPNWCTMVIPKPNASPSVVNLEMAGPCVDTAWDLRTFCPALLPSFSTSSSFPSSSIPCITPITQTHYFAKVHTAVDTYIGLYDYVFTDPNGQYPLADGYYLTNNVAAPNKVIHVVNGVVTSISNCI